MKFSFAKKSDAVALVCTERSATRMVVNGKQETLEIGVGPFKSLNERKFFLLLRRIVTEANAQQLESISIDFKELEKVSPNLKEAELAQKLASQCEVASYVFDTYKSKPKDAPKRLVEIQLLNAESHKKDIERGQIIGQEINVCRELANTPAGLMTPEMFADAAKRASKGTSVRVKALDVDDMKLLGMGGVLGVGQGSDHEPRFIITEYFGAKNKKESPVVLVGKGITYDSGGINLKPSQGGFLNEMHMDMAGGAAAIHTIILAAKLGIKKNIVALVPAAENMVSGSSYHPSDVLRTMSGKTIEVVDTDAEGRVVMSDALTYAEKYKPELVIDIATLTGAAMVALGQRATALFTKDEKLEKTFRDLGELSGDYVWPLPLWDEYEDDVKGMFGDWANLAKNPRYGGAITAAVFLYQWAKNYPWVHLDIAPTMTAIEGQYLAKGATGVPISLLIKFLSEL